MKLSSRTSLSETLQARTWAPLDIAQPSPAGRPDLSAQVLSIFTPPASQTPAVSPLPEEKALIRGVDQAQGRFQTWLPGEMDTPEPPLSSSGTPLVLFLSAPKRHPTAIDPAAAILAEARRKADAIIFQAHQSEDEILQRAAAQSELAIAEGYAKGHEDARTEAVSALLSAQAMIAELADWREQMIAQSEETILAMIRQIARLMFGSGIRLDKDALQTYLNEVVENTRSLGDLNILLNPDDLTHLEPAWAERQAQIRGSRVRISGSASVLPGGCLIKGQMGSVDASVETKLSAVCDTLSPQPDAGAQE